MKFIPYLFLSMLIAACGGTAKVQKNMPAPFEKQGHRGCRGLMPENTIPAMRRALDLGVTTLEMDVVISKDKQVVVSHDHWFSKDITTKPDGTYMGEREERKFNIYWMTYDQVQTFDVGLKPHPGFPKQEKLAAVKPLLSQLIDSVEAHAVATHRPLAFYNIEIKTQQGFDGVFHPQIDEFIDLVIPVIQSKKIEARVNIQSFDIRALQAVHKKYPFFSIGLLIDGADKRDMEAQVKELGFKPTTYSPAYQLVNASLVKKCHQQKMRIVPWTVNNKEKMQELKTLGVDGIISDYPNLFNELQ